MNSLYFDNNATTPISSEVVDAMRVVYETCWGNPASQHRLGQKSKRALEDAREQIAECLGCRLDHPADQVIFTSGGTEANNLALRGLGERRPGQIIVSAIEHPSVMECAQAMAREGCDVQTLPSRSSGVVQLDRLESLLSNETRCVSLMAVNNETGVIQPVAEAAKTCRAASIPFHTDAVQSVANLEFRFDELEVTAMSISAHKFHGPIGIGALLLRHDAQLAPRLYGGGQQLGLRPGTESVALAVGMAVALVRSRETMKNRIVLMQQFRNEFIRRLCQSEPELIVHGLEAPCTEHTVNLSFPGVDRQELVMALDMQNVACSTGSACASGSSEPSPTLAAMGVNEAEISSSLRFSFSGLTTLDEIREGVKRILLVYRNLRDARRARIWPASSRKPASKGV